MMLKLCKMILFFLVAFSSSTSVVSSRASASSLITKDAIAEGTGTVPTGSHGDTKHHGATTNPVAGLRGGSGGIVTVAKVEDTTATTSHDNGGDNNKHSGAMVENQRILLHHNHYHHRGLAASYDKDWYRIVSSCWYMCWGYRPKQCPYCSKEWY